MTDHQQNSLPSSLSNEIAILGSMLLDALAISDATAKLRSEDFSLDSHQRIYRAILGLLSDNHAVDFLTVQDYLAKKRELDAIGGPAYLAYLTEGIPRNLNIESYVRIVKDKSLLRQIHSICSEGSASALDQGEEALKVLDNLDAELSKLRMGSTSEGLSGVGDIVSESFGSIDAIYDRSQIITGVETHFVEFDKMTGGLHAGELIIIAGRPGAGKTSWAMNVAQNAAIRDGKVVAVFSLEMTREALLKRMISSEASVDGRAIQAGFVRREDRRRCDEALERLIESRLRIDDTSNITLPELRSRCRRLLIDEGSIDLIVIDYIQLFVGNSPRKKGDNETQEISAISRGLKALSKELKVPVVALSQLSRASEQRGGSKKPMLSDLRGSGSLEQDSDICAFVHRDSYYDRDNEALKGLADLMVEKHRNGRTGTIKMAYLEQYTRFDNLAKDTYSATGSLDPEWTGNAY